MNAENHAFLQALNDRLWPKGYKSKSPVALDSTGKITVEEWVQVKEVIEHEGLLTSMFCANMFGAYGMDVYTHPSYPGVPPQLVLTLVEGNLPGKHEKRPGSGSDFAWDEFSKFTHSERNRAWLREYKMAPPMSRGSYDY